MTYAYVYPVIHRVTDVISTPAGFRRHLVGKTLRNVLVSTQMTKTFRCGPAAGPPPPQTEDLPGCVSRNAYIAHVCTLHAECAHDCSFSAYSIDIFNRVRSCSLQLLNDSVVVYL